MNQIVSFPGLPPAAATRIATKLLGKHDARQIAEAIEVLIDVLDMLGGDPEAEDTDLEDDFRLSDLAMAAGSRAPGDIIAEPPDTAWVEWHTMHGNQKKRGQNLLAGHEDDEEDDPAEEGGDEHDTGNAEDEDLTEDARRYGTSGAGCPISEPDVEHDGTEEQQMGCDVPMLPAYSLDHNLFNDQRQFVGIVNLMSSFKGQAIKSADTGAVHSSRPRDPEEPGTPV